MEYKYCVVRQQYGNEIVTGNSRFFPCRYGSIKPAMFSNAFTYVNALLTFLLGVLSGAEKKPVFVFRGRGFAYK
jgi:hypothetical protein